MIWDAHSFVSKEKPTKTSGFAMSFSFLVYEALIACYFLTLSKIAKQS